MTNAHGLDLIQPVWRSEVGGIREILLFTYWNVLVFKLSGIPIYWRSDILLEYIRMLSPEYFLCSTLTENHDSCRKIWLCVYVVLRQHGFLHISQERPSQFFHCSCCPRKDWWELHMQSQKVSVTLLTDSYSFLQGVCSLAQLTPPTGNICFIIRFNCFSNSHQLCIPVNSKKGHML